MKPPPFEYVAPDTQAEALEAARQAGSDAKFLAGGQSLVPAMNFRITQPALLIDLNRIPGLDTIRRGDGGGVHFGAMTRQRRLELDPIVATGAFAELCPSSPTPDRNQERWREPGHADRPASPVIAVASTPDSHRFDRGDRWSTGFLQECSPPVGTEKCW
jgi:hypothetical protein